MVHRNPQIVLQRCWKITVVHNRAHQEQKAMMHRKLKELHGSKNGKCFRDRQAINKIINDMVEEYNRETLKRRCYCDLHGMTPSGALDYVKRMMEMLEEVQLETGRGNHSKNGIPKIKRSILEVYSSLEGFEIGEDPYNPGVLNLRKIL